MKPRDIENAIAEAVADSSDIRRQFDDFADEVVETWRELAPVDTGTYRRSIKRRSLAARLSAAALRRGAPVAEIFSDDDPDKVAAIEYGTQDTPEHAPMRRTAARFQKD